MARKRLRDFSRYKEQGGIKSVTNRIRQLLSWE